MRGRERRRKRGLVEQRLDGTAASEQAITIGWGAEPPSLDPGLATDVTSSNILLNIMDPLVKLGADLEPVPSLAESWDVSDDGKTVTFHLRGDGKWTNGDPVTAEDFEWSWKRTVSPELAADYAYQFYGIVGAADYNACQKNCDALRDAVGVKALDERTLEVQADLRTAVVRAAGEPPLLPGRSPGHRRAVRRQLDRSEEHRHGRPVQARVVGARLLDRPREERRRGAEPKTSRSRA